MNVDYLKQHKDAKVWKPVGGIVGPQKISLLTKFFKKKMKHHEINCILDVGGNYPSYVFFQGLFKNKNIVSLNLFKEAIEKCENSVVGDARKLPFKENAFDLVVAMDIIEHLWSPDDFLVDCKSCLKKDGILVITTPNLACWHNRIFLLLGYSLANYHPSFRYRTGNPFLKRTMGDHKSVFTLMGLKEL
jgi:SAM-dependent methyltransferase